MYVLDSDIPTAGSGFCPALDPLCHVHILVILVIMIRGLFLLPRIETYSPSYFTMLLSPCILL